MGVDDFAGVELLHHDDTNRDDLDKVYDGSLKVEKNKKVYVQIDPADEGQKLTSLEDDHKSSSHWGRFDKKAMMFTGTPTTITKEVLDELLVRLDAMNVDDVVIQSDEKIFAKINNDMFAVTRRITFSEVSEVLVLMHRDSTPGKVRSGDPQKFAYSVPYQESSDGPVKHVRFRCKATACQGLGGSQDGLDITMRCIDAFPKTMDELNVPEGIRDLAFPDSGIVLVTGETGSGKTTLLGSVMRYWATFPKGRRIITYNDPIEYDYRAIPGRTASIAQTEVGEMIASFNESIPDAMRRNPHIIELGEVSEQIGIKNVIVAAQTGHLVYTTVHTESAAITLDRMVEPFPQDEQAGKIRSLIATTRGIVHQRLLDRKGGGRVAVQEWIRIGREEREILYNTPRDNFVSVMQKLVEERGRSLLQDLESKKDLVTDEMYTLTKRELVGGVDD